MTQTAPVAGGTAVSGPRLAAGALAATGALVGLPALVQFFQGLFRILTGSGDAAFLLSIVLFLLAFALGVGAAAVAFTVRRSPVPLRAALGLAVVVSLAALVVDFVLLVARSGLGPGSSLLFELGMPQAGNWPWQTLLANVGVVLWAVALVVSLTVRSPALVVEATSAVLPFSGAATFSGSMPYAAVPAVVPTPVAQSAVPPPPPPPPIEPAVPPPPPPIDPAVQAPPSQVPLSQVPRHGAGPDPSSSSALGSAPDVAHGGSASGMIDAPWRRSAPDVESPPAAEPIDDHTILRGGTALIDAAPRDASPVALVFDSGERVTLGRFCLVGRDPAAAADDPPAVLFGVEDQGRSVSKTHLAVGLTPDGRVWVLDRHSTNGVTVEDGSGARRTPPGEQTFIPRGALVRFGDRRFEVQ